MTDPELAVRRRTPDSVFVLAMVLACLPILAVSIFAAQARMDDIDAVLFAYYGKRMVAGQQLYVDLWDNKPPGIFWMDALSLGLAHGSYAGIVVACSLAVLGSCVLFFAIARRLFNLQVAAIGTVLAALYMNLYYYRVGSNRPSTFYIFFELCVMFFYCRSFGSGASRWRNMTGAGVCALAALCFRQTACAASAAIVVHQVFLLLTGRRTREAFFGVVRAYLGGFILAAIAVVLILWWTSDLSDAWHAVVASNVGYFSASKQSQPIPVVYGWNEHVEVLGLPMIIAAAAIFYESVSRPLVGAAPARSGTGETPPAPFILLAAWLLVAVYLALIGPHGALRYYAVALPPLVMVATHGVWLLLRREGSDHHPRFHVVLILLWFGYLVVPAIKHQLSFANVAKFQRFDERATLRHASTIEAIEQYTAPDDPIFVWGYAPQVYWSTNRPQAQRYILMTLIDQWGTAAQPYVDEVIRDLKNDPPNAIVVSRAEMGTFERPPDDDAIRYGDLASWIRRRYAVPDDCPSDDVWVRRE